MKKILLVAIIGLFTVSGFAQKLGHINSQEIVLDMSDYEVARDSVKLKKEQLDKTLIMYQNIIQKKEKEFQENQQNPDYPKSELESEYQFLQEKYVKYQEVEYQNQQILQMYEQEMLQRLFEKVQKAVEVVAKDKGYAYVFEETTLLYKGGDDLNEAVRKQLGVAPKSN